MYVPHVAADVSHLACVQNTAKVQEQRHGTQSKSAWSLSPPPPSCKYILQRAVEEQSIVTGLDPDAWLFLVWCPTAKYPPMPTASVSPALCQPCLMDYQTLDVSEHHDQSSVTKLVSQSGACKLMPLKCLCKAYGLLYYN